MGLFLHCIPGRIKAPACQVKMKLALLHVGGMLEEGKMVKIKTYFKFIWESTG